MKHSVWIILLALLITNFSFPQQKFSITFSPAVGNFLPYRVDITIRAEGKDFSGKEISLGGTASGEISFAVKRSVQKIVFMAITIPEIQVESHTLAEPQKYTLRTKENMSLQAAFDQKGSLQEIHNLEALNQVKIWNISFVQILSDYLPTLPEKPVSPGETWNDKKSLNIPFQGMNLEAQIERTYTLLNIMPSDQGGMAFISVDYEVKLSGSQKWGEWMGNFEGKGSGGGILNFDVQRGSIQEFRAEYQTEALFILKRGNQSVMQQPFKLFVSASLVIKN